jgi:CubicO group peptidase (beta-lactamase class C family)
MAVPIFTAVALALVSAAPQAHAQEDTSSKAQVFAKLSDVELVRRVEALLDEFRVLPGFVGLSVAVARGDEIVFERGVGIADVEWNLPADADTVFGIGSITKQFTAAAIMKLVEEGELGLDDPLGQYLPDFDTGGRAVTIRQLLNHTSGIPEYSTLDYWQKTSRLNLTDLEVLNLVKGGPPDFEPGTSWRYTNTNYRLLGMIVEKLRGRPYADALRDDFFEPLGLTRTQEWGDQIIPRRAQGYWFDVESQTLGNADALGSAGAGGQGGLVSTVGDLIRWQVALTNGRAVSPASFERMITSTVPSGQGVMAYGFGLQIDSPQGLRRIAHGGLTSGFTGALTWLPDVGLRIAVLSNSMQFPSALVEERITAALTSEAMPPPLRISEDPRMEAALRKAISELASGTPDYAAMVPQLGDLTRTQLPRIQPMLNGWGRVKSVTFIRVDLPEVHLYRVEFASGPPAIFSIGLTPDGKIAGLGFRPLQHRAAISSAAYLSVRFRPNRTFSRALVAKLGSIRHLRKTS